MSSQDCTQTTEALEQENQRLRSQLKQVEQELSQLRSQRQTLQHSEQTLQQQCGELTTALESVQQQTETALRDSEARFQHLAANMPGAIYQFKLLADGTATFPYISSGCYGLFEVTPDQIYAAGANLLIEVIHPEDRPGFDRSVTLSAQTLEPWRWEGRFMLPSGAVKWVQGASRPELQADGSIVWDGLLMDVTQRKEAEAALQRLNDELEERVQQQMQALHQSEVRFQRLADNLPGMIFQSRATPAGEIVFLYASEGCRDLLEVPPSEAERVFEFVPPEDWPDLEAAIARAIQTPGKFQHEHRIVVPSGQMKWVQVIGRTEQQADGSVLCDGVTIDISDRKQAESQLLEQEQFLRSVYDGVEYLIFTWDVVGDGEFRNSGWNAATERATGLERPDVLGQSPIEVFGPLEGEEVQQHYLQCIAANRAITYEECLTFDDQKNWWLTTLNPLKDKTGKIYRIVGTTFDITERKQAEEALRSSRQDLQTIFDNVYEAIFIHDTKGRILDVNRKMLEMYGLRREEALMLSIEDFSGPDNPFDQIPERFKQVMAGQNLLFEWTSRRPLDGHLFEVEVYLHRVMLDNQPVVLANVRDISDRKRQEKALRSIVEGTAAQTGEAFFKSCVQHLAQALEVRYALIAETCTQARDRVRTLAFWAGEDFGQNIEYDLAGTPCANVYQTRSRCLYPETVQPLFPDDAILPHLHAESYAGIPVIDSHGNPLGLLAVLDIKPMTRDLETQSAILEIFAARAGAEIEQMRAEKALQQSTQRLEKQAKREQLLNCITNQIRSSLDLETIQNTTVQEVRSFLAIDRCHFAWYRTDLEEPYWDVVSESRQPDLPNFLGRYPAAIFGPLSEIVLRQEVVRIDSTDNIQDTEVRQYIRILGNQSMLVLPLRSQSGAIGLLACIHNRAVRPWNDDEVSLLQAAIAQLTIAFNQAELYAQSQSRTQELQQALEKLKRTQTQLIQSEKMSSLGQLVAGVAHEINNPVNFIYGNITPATEYIQDLMQLLQRYQNHYPNPPADIVEEIEIIDLDFLLADLPRLLDSMKIGSDRIRQIVLSLRRFSRLDEAEVKAVDIHEGLDSTLMILQSRLKSKSDSSGIQIIKEYGDLPPIECYSGQLNQVFMNLLVNAIDALEMSKSWQNRSEELLNSWNDRKFDDSDRTSNFPSAHSQAIQRLAELDNLETPTIWIRTEVVATQAIVRIFDNGPGMSETVSQRIFDPFFTTKSIGKGTGLGLSISHQIVVEKHQGQLECYSVPGKGTEFTITIPQKCSEKSGGP